MTVRWGRFLATAPVFLYGSWLLAGGVAVWAPGAILVAALVALPALSFLRPERLGWLIAPSILVFLFLALVTWFSPSVPSGGGADLVAGTLLGVPLWFLGVAVAISERPGIGLLAFQAGLLEVVLVVVTLGGSSGPFPSSDAFVAAWFANIGHQIGALGAALTVSGLSGTLSVPLAAEPDPTLVLLALVGLGGVLLPFLAPGASAPVASPKAPRRDLATPRRSLPPPVLYATSEPATLPVPFLGAGVWPAVGAGLAAAGFLAVALAAPAYTFLGVSIGAAVAILVLLRLSMVPRARPKPTPVPR